MYQSFPQRHYNRSNTAMPVIKEPPCEKKETKCEKEISECCETKQNNPFGNIFGSLEIEELILKRTEARKNKDWALADKIRDDLKARGIVLEDTPDGDEDVAPGKTLMPQKVFAIKSMEDPVQVQIIYKGIVISEVTHDPKNPFES